MIKIALVVPFKDFIKDVQSVFNLHNSNNHDMPKDEEYSLEEIITESDQLENLKTDADCIIARGLFAEILKNSNIDIPIVEVSIQGSDMLDNLLECKKVFGNRQVGVVASNNMVYDVEEMAKVTKLVIKPYSLKKDLTADILVKKAIDDGCDVILGGVSACEAASKFGVSNLLIRTGHKSFYQSITEAKRAALIGRKAQGKSNMYKKILDYTYGGIIAVNSDNQITIVNISARQILNIKTDKVIGLDTNSAPFPQELKNIIQDNQEYINEIIQKNDDPIMLNKVFTYVKGEKTDCIITMQKVQHIQKMEEAIRKNIINNGYVAKYTFDDIVAVSSITKNIVRVAKNFSLTESNILLTGESGTGKEIFAQSIHNFSRRKGGPFVAVNCASLPGSLLESELFGYAAGAFTGASRTGKLGYFGMANNGTIFLDEIAEMPLEFQSKLLRVLQERQFTRLGDNKVINVNVRIITATNKNLDKLVKQGKFRNDLFYRLDVLRINIPNLRSRPEDIPALAECFIKMLNPHKSLSKKAMELLKSYAWDGNVRQLRNFCERLEVLTTSPVITDRDILYVHGLTINSMDDNEALNSLLPDALPEKDEDQRIRQALISTKYNRQDAAKLLNMNRSTLWRKMKEYGIK